MAGTDSGAAGVLHAKGLGGGKKVIPQLPSSVWRLASLTVWCPIP